MKMTRSERFKLLSWTLWHSAPNSVYVMLHRVFCNFVNSVPVNCLRHSRCLLAQWLATQARRNTQKYFISSHHSSLLVLYTIVTSERVSWSQR